MFASVSTYQGPPDQIDEGLRYAQENIVPSLQEVEGFEGLYLLVDRQSGKVLTITLWESEEEATQLRSEHRGQWDQVPTTGAGSQEVAGVERYEVAISPERS
jgi:heme-degrading monooxygenase HmoA